MFRDSEKKLIEVAKKLLESQSPIEGDVEVAVILLRLALEKNPSKMDGIYEVNSGALKGKVYAPISCTRLLDTRAF